MRLLYAAVFDGHQGGYAGDFLVEELYPGFSKIIDMAADPDVSRKIERRGERGSGEGEEEEEESCPRPPVWPLTLRFNTQGRGPRGWSTIFLATASLSSFFILVFLPRSAPCPPLCR